MDGETHSRAVRLSVPDAAQKSAQRLPYICGFFIFLFQNNWLPKAMILGQRTSNPRVGGSIPPLGTIKSKNYIVL